MSRISRKSIFTDVKWWKPRKKGYASRTIGCALMANPFAMSYDTKNIVS